MSSPQPARRLRIAFAASFTALVGLLGTAMLGPVQPAGAQDGPAARTSFQPTDDQTATRMVDVGGGDRVAVTSIGGGSSTLTTLPGPDGAAPGLITERTGAGTTVRTTDPASVPTLVAGHEAPRPAISGAATVPLHFNVTGRDGRPANAYVSVFDVETGATRTSGIFPEDGPVDPSCTVGGGMTSCVMVPPGRYSVMALVLTLPAQDPGLAKYRTYQSISIVGTPETEVDGERTFDLDARDAEPVNVRTPGHRTKVPALGMELIGYDRTAANGAEYHMQLWPKVLLDQHFYLQPTAQVTTGTFQTRTRIALEAPDIELSAPFARKLHPEYVDSQWFASVSSEFPVVDGRSQLKVVDVGHATQADLAGVKLHGALALVTHADGISQAEQSNRAAAHGASVVVIRNDGPGDISDPGGKGVMLKVPTIRLDREEGLALARLPKHTKVTVRGESASPYLYDLYLKNHGRIPEHPGFVARAQDLVTQVRTIHGQPTGDQTFSTAAFALQPEETVAYTTNFPFRGGARTRTEYRVPDPDTRWRYSVTTPEFPQNGLFPEPETARMGLDTAGYETNDRPASTTPGVAAAPIVPEPDGWLPFQRAGDRINIRVKPFTDQVGNQGTASTEDAYSSYLEVFVDGESIGGTDGAPSGIAQVPAGASTVSARYTSDNEEPWAQLSTHTDTTWTWPTTTTPTDHATIESVLVPHYDVDVDLHNRVQARAGTPVSLLLSLDQPEGAVRVPVRSVRFDVSYDDGQTWRPAKVRASGHRWRVELSSGTGHLSFRLRAEDTAGGSVDQTVIRAFDVVH